MHADWILQRWVRSIDPCSGGPKKNFLRRRYINIYLGTKKTTVFTKRAFNPVLRGSDSMIIHNRQRSWFSFALSPPNQISLMLLISFFFSIHGFYASLSLYIYPKYTKHSFYQLLLSLITCLPMPISFTQNFCLPFNFYLFIFCYVIRW